ncbi:MAG: anaerobic ribonucleoside-triphosphate reductase activating protein [Selenomonadaceae bacterium]|nr:anaerobic ribonucleoside-triphosphate reductase activating protein [Selenomonadaceae bacterium]
MKIQIAGIVEESCVDGSGIRFTVFLQGCLRHCKGCHNPTTHDLNGGKTVDTSDIINKIKDNPILTGLTLSGGEPLLQIKPAIELAQAAKNFGLDVWLYTGFKFKEIPNDANELLKLVDVVVDGEYIDELRDLNLNFRGPSNQWIIFLNHKR